MKGSQKLDSKAENSHLVYCQSRFGSSIVNSRATVTSVSLSPQTKKKREADITRTN